MGQLGWVWFGGRDTIAVLYSVLVNRTREFWIKTKSSDVKVAEIPGTFDPDEAAPTNIGGTGASITVSGALGPISGFVPGQQNIPNSAGYLLFDGSQITGKSIQGAGWNIVVTGSVTWTGQNTGQDVNDRALAAAGWLLPNGRLGWGNTVVGGPNVVFHSPSTISTSIGLGSSTQASCLQFRYLNLDLLGPGVASVSYTATVTITGWLGSTTYPYRAWLSSDAQGNIFVIVKWVDFDYACSDLDEESNEGSVQFNRLEVINLKLVDGKTGAAVDYHYRDKASVARRTANWRQDQENFFYNGFDSPLDDISPCARAVLENTGANLRSGMLYTIDLNQVISGQTLKNRLQSSTNPANASVSFRSATVTDALCTLGSISTETIQIHGPGRGNVEGIIYV